MDFDSPYSYSWRSLPQIPHHSTATSAWCSAGSGFGTSPTRMSLRAKNCAAFMFFRSYRAEFRSQDRNALLKSAMQTRSRGSPDSMLASQRGVCLRVESSYTRTRYWLSAAPAGRVRPGYALRDRLLGERRGVLPNDELYVITTDVFKRIRHCRSDARI